MTDQPHPDSFTMPGPDGPVTFAWFQPDPETSVMVLAGVLVEGPFTDHTGAAWYLWRVSADGGRVKVEGVAPTTADAWAAAGQAATETGLHALAAACARKPTSTTSN